MQLSIIEPSGEASTIALGTKALSLGRAADNDLPYPNDPALSRRHLCIDPASDNPAKDGWTVRDCGSRNGTILNEAQLRKPQLLRSGDRIYVGNLTIEVRGVDGEPFTSPRALTGTLEGTKIATTLEEVLAQNNAPDDHSTSKNLGSTRVVSALIRAGRELAGHRPINELFDLILDLALSAVEARRGVIATTEADTLVVQARRGEGFELSKAVRNDVMNNKTSLIISDARFDAALREQKSIVAQQIRSIMAVPLQTAERVIGMIYVDNGAVLRPFSREDLDLLTVMANVAAVRIEHARLALVEQQERLMQVDLDQACEIQRSLLPEAAPVLSGFELAGYNLACRAVGGDYYDFLPYGDGRMGLFVADVCGKGMPAALMMSSLQARVQMLAESDPSPATAVATLNRNLSGRFPLGRFITAFFGLLDPATGLLEYANAGHNYPLLLRGNGATEELQGGSMVLGLFPHIEYKRFEVCLEPGDVLALFSDGVTEAARPDGEFFGEERLAAFLHSQIALPCSTIVANLVDHVRTWSGATQFSDDFTMVLVRRATRI